MPLIAPQIRRQREPMTMRFDVRVLALLKRYAEFIDSSADYVISQSVIATLLNDDGFRTWLFATHPDDAGCVEEMTAERTQLEPRRRR